MATPPKVESATIRYDDGTWVSIREADEGRYIYRYYGDADSDGDIDLVAYNDRNSGIWAAMMAVAAMAQVPGPGWTVTPEMKMDPLTVFPIPKYEKSLT